MGVAISIIIKVYPVWSVERYGIPSGVRILNSVDLSDQIVTTADTVDTECQWIVSNTIHPEEVPVISVCNRTKIAKDYIYSKVKRTSDSGINRI